MSEPLLEVKDLTIQYETPAGNLTAVSGASFTIDEGNYFGLVGESGCGKSTLARSVMQGLPDNGFIKSGEIFFKGTPIHDKTPRQFNEEIRWKEISWIPQSSMSSLDPLQRISEQVVDIAKTHTDWSKKATKKRLGELFEVVGLQSSRMRDYPHQFSGGMQQRAIIAIALLFDSSLIIADEPTTALDVIMQDQVLRYFDEIKENLNTSLLLITHDISVIFETCDDMAVMHAGQVAETGPVSEIYDDPRHPYSILLQEAFPDYREPDKELVGIQGNIPQTRGEVNACTFADRCPWVVEECRQHEPSLETHSGADMPSSHRTACFRRDEVLDLYRSDDQKLSTQTRD